MKRKVDKALKKRSRTEEMTEERDEQEENGTLAIRALQLIKEDPSLHLDWTLDEYTPSSIRNALHVLQKGELKK